MCPYLETVKSLHPLSNNQTATCAPEFINIFTSGVLYTAFNTLSALHDSRKCIALTTDLPIKEATSTETLEGHALFTPNQSSNFPKLTEIILPLQIPLEILLMPGMSHAWIDRQ